MEHAGRACQRDLRLRHHRRGSGVVPGGDRGFSRQVQERVKYDACSKGRVGWEYVIAWAEETSIGRDIPITQQDVRQIQLAKAALFTAARTLLKRSNLESPDKIILAGGFGSYIDKEKAMLIGLIPDCELDNVYAVGNAAGDGARIALLNIEKRNEIDTVTRKVERFELPTDPEFQNQFMLATSFPHMSEPFPHIAHLIPNRKADPMAKNFMK
jgi:uncharacterized 2Fe-2S/4Fe-4S cluster protein (DUF4445 family)